MTLEELCEKYGVAPSTVKSNFKRFAETMRAKHGVIITKQGRGANARYHTDFIDDQRALTMYEENKEEVCITEANLGLENFNFLIFLAIMTTPMLVFRGSYDDFLQYIECAPTDSNKVALKEGLQALCSARLISYTVDITDSNYFIAALWHQVETELEVNIKMIQTCKRLADKYNKRSWVPLLKTWMGIQVLPHPYTVADVCAITGLSEYQVRESSKILESNNVYITNKAYRGLLRCVGKNAEMNREEFLA